MPVRLIVTASCCFVFASICVADWPQWRGPERNGYVASAPLIRELPEQGLKTVWQFDGLAGGNSGGWGSPVVSDGHVFVYSHTKNKTGDPGKKQYPWLSPDKRVGMSDEEYREYEVKRRNEDEMRAKAYQFEQRLLCLDVHTGDVIWDRKWPGVYTRFVQSVTPCVADGKVFVLGPERTAHCLDAGTGEMIWQQRLPGEFRDEFFASSFAVAGDVALVACGPLFALNVLDGKVLWSGDTKEDYASHSSPVVWDTPGGPVAICNTSGGRTQGYQIENGKKLWELNTGVSQSSPIVAGDILLTYGSSRKSGLTAYQLWSPSPEKQPEELWRYRGTADSGSSPVVRGDFVFVQGEKRIAKVNLKDGNRVWQKTMQISTPKYTSLIAAGDQVFFAWEGVLALNADSDNFETIYKAKVDADGVLITEDNLRDKLGLDEVEKGDGGLEKSQSLWQKNAVRSGPLNCSTPAFSDGNLIIRCNNRLVCFRLRDDAT